MLEISEMTVETPEAPAEPTTRIKPGEAIRIGRLQVPLKTRGRLLVRRSSGEVIAACALGAMAVGYGEEPDEGDSHWWPKEMPDPELAMPCCRSNCERLSRIVAHVNDYHIAVPKGRQTWTEQRLADWVDGVLAGR